MIDRDFIQACQQHIRDILYILFFIVLLIGVKLITANLPISCRIEFLGPSSVHCGSLYRLCKGH